MVSGRKVIALLVAVYILWQFIIPMAQETYRRYIVPQEYDQRIIQDHLDDIAKRLDRLEQGGR